MTDITKKKELRRIEDFIALAGEGKRVNLTIELRKEVVAQKIHPEDSTELRKEKDMYILFGDFTFTAGGDKKTVSKSYVYGSTEESLNETKISKQIANDRLKMDYKRLKTGSIEFTEKFF